MVQAQDIRLRHAAGDAIIGPGRGMAEAVGESGEVAIVRTPSGVIDVLSRDW